MTELIATLATLRRPRLLIRAARCGQPDYIRARTLRHVLHCDALPSPAEAATILLALEAEQEAARVEKSACYSVLHHIEILIALMAEARAIPCTAVPAIALAAE